MDTADLAETQAVSDAHARGEAPRWFRIGEASELTEGGWTRKLDDNLNALKLLKQLEREDRPATDAEQAVLARYVGWGHTELAAVVDLQGVDHIRDPRKKQAREELDQLLTKAELKDLGESTANAHYSFAELPRAMWALVQQLGFKAGTIIEPAVGSGHFLGTMPGSIQTARRTTVYGVDKEPIAAGIAKQLYQGAHIQASPLEEATLPEGYFDLAISNVPFGKIEVFDPAFVSPEKTPLTRSIHNYYFAKALDLLRPGGLAVFVTSRYTLDSQDDSVRRYLAKRATFLGAFRLPDQAFRKTAGTDVVTDVIVLQKHGEGVKASGPAWLKSSDRQDLGSQYDSRSGRQQFVRTNEYFTAHPDQVLGKEARSGKMSGFGGQYNVEGTLSPEQLAGAVAALPSNVYKPAKTAPRKVATAAQKDTKQGAFVVQDGELFTYDRGSLTPSPLKGTMRDRALAFIPLRDAYQGVLEQLLKNAPDAELLAAQKTLGLAYQRFVKAHGHVNTRTNRRIIEADPNASRVLALENIDVIKGEKGQPSAIVVTGLADIFTKRLMRPPTEPTTADSADDALVQSVAWKGGVDLPYMETLTGKPATAITQELAGKVFQDPAANAWVPRDEYLSGDVVTKLAQAQAAAKTAPALAANVAALTKVQPTKLTIDDFTGDPSSARQAPFGATWVPVPLLTRFLNENGAPEASIRLLNSTTKVTWYVEGWGRHEFMPGGTEYARWVEQSLNGELPTVYTKGPDGERVLDPEGTERYRQSLAQLREQWATWWKGDPEASKQLVDIYNAMFNREAPRVFDGSQLVLPNSNPEVQLREGQKASVVGALLRGNTLLAQAVGWGKTYEMIAIAGEWKRRGLAHKPVIVVPNHIVEQWRRDFLRFYPAARVLLPEKRDFETGNRKRLIARVANNDWDAVVLGASQFLRIGVKLSTLKTYIAEQEEQLLSEGALLTGMDVEAFSEAIDDYGTPNPSKSTKQAIAGRGVPRTVKDIARAVLNLRKRLKKRTDQQGKDPINFEELGIDGLIVDEAHMFKNLYFFTGKTDIVGLKGSDADQALDMYLKVRHINTTSNFRNTVFATGTPITNTMSELYTNFRYLAPQTLERLGMAGFDSWANGYAQAVGSPEPTPEGGYKDRTRLSQWANLKELSNAFRRFADVITSEDILKENARLEAAGKPPLLKLPTAKKVTIQLDPHPQFPAFMEDLIRRIDAIKKGSPDVLGFNEKTQKNKVDNFLTITTAAGLAAVDMRLVLKDATDDPHGRLRVAAKEIADRYHASTATKGTQLAFLDVGVPKGNDIPALPASIAAKEELEEGDDAPEVESPDLVDEEAEAERALEFEQSQALNKNLYGELKRLLMAKGVKEDEIAFIHQARNASEQHRLSQAVRDGKIRVLLLTRAKGGTGLNVQDKVVALHHLDVPWRPDQMEQAEGRAIRQGNTNSQVEIVRYVTKKSFDEYRWYLLAKKQGFISAFYRGELGSAEDIDPTQLDMQVAAALASGDPRVMQMIVAERALVGLRARAENFSRRHAQAERDRRAAEQTIKSRTKELPALKALAGEMRTWEAHPTITIDRGVGRRAWNLEAVTPRTIDLHDDDAEKQKAARQELAQVLTGILDLSHITDTPIGHAGPFLLARDTVTTEDKAKQDEKGSYYIEKGREAAVLTVKVDVAGTPRLMGTTSEWNPEKPGTIIQSLATKFKTDWATDQIDTAERGIASAVKEKAAAEVILEKRFEQGQELVDKEQEVRELRLALGIDKAQKAAEAKAGEGEEEPMLVEEPGRPRHGPIAQSTIIPGAAQFAERDVVPALNAAAKEVVEATGAIRALWAPARVSPAAETMAAVMRPNLAIRRQRGARAQKAMRKLEVAWDRMPQKAQVAFAEAVDEGRLDDLPPEQRAQAALFRSINTQKRNEANALGGRVGYVENYFPREWVKPGKVREFIARALYGKRPLQGRAGFKKARSRDKETGEVFSFKRLHAAGFEPVSYNPVTAHLRKWVEMDKWIAARRILLMAKEHGVATFVRVGEKPPEGEIRYAESFGTVYGPPLMPVKEAFDAGLMEAIHRFAEEHGIKTVRRVNLGGQRWGYHVRKGDLSEIHTRFGGPEGVLMHEIGHVLDHQYGLGEKIGLAQNAERHEEINFAETPSKVVRELRALADLRTDKRSSQTFRKYVRKRGELIANLVHGFLYAPDLTRDTAPNAYWALYNLAKDEPDLRGLLDVQKARSLRIGANVGIARIQGKVIKGYYYGPVDAVRLLDNHLSPGLRGNVAFDLYRTAGNFLNQVQLGLSVFHVLTTSTNSTVSKGALALEELARGHVGQALKHGAQAATLVLPPILDVIKGHRYLKEFYARDAQFRDLVDDVDVIARGGGGVGWDRFWHESAPERVLQAFRNAGAEAKTGNYPGAAVRLGKGAVLAVPAAFELMAKPVMEWWVPRLKLAAFMDLARMELRDLGPTPDPLEAAKVLGRVWDSIDNRFGELIYDNIFWHAVLKDAGMASVRALGWNLGTVREVFGALPAQAAQFGLLPGAGGGFGKPPLRMRNVGTQPGPNGEEIPTYALGKAPWLTHQFAYLIALLVLSAMMGALYQFAHTGLRPGEEKDGSTSASTLLLDLYFPRTGAFKEDGRPERATLWTYMKDVFAFLRHPVDTAAGKANPLLSLLVDLIKNEDYFGNAMRNEDDPLVRQVADMLRYVSDQYRPISLRNYQTRRAETGESGIGALESFLGVNVAPQKVTRSAAEDYLHSLNPTTPKTKAQAEHATTTRELKKGLRTSNSAAIAAAMAKQELSRRSVVIAARTARLDALQRGFQRTTLPQALHAYELATPEERIELRATLGVKMRSLLGSVPAGDRKSVQERFSAALKLPVAARPAPAVAR